VQFLWFHVISCPFCCSEFLCTLQLDVKNDPSDLLMSVCGMPDPRHKSHDNDIVSRLFEGQVVNLVCSPSLPFCVVPVVTFNFL